MSKTQKKSTDSKKTVTRVICLVLAGAGSGKTRVITNKIVALIKDHGYSPESICALTFTNKAAAEMADRVKAELGSDTVARISISTFHSLGLNILKTEYQAAGMYKNFTLYNQYDSLKVIRDIVKTDFPKLLENVSERDYIEEIASAISSWKSSLLRPEDLNVRTIRSEVYAAYQKYIEACNAMDFEDLIFKTTILFRDNNEVRTRYASHFRYILVDEYQDTNETQYQLLRYLTSVHRCFTVVGDDDQSIYAWRGARPENIRLIAQDYPDLKVIKLEQNYRSTRHILNCANLLISHNDHIFEKKLYTAGEEGHKVVVIEKRTETDELEMMVSLISAKQYVTGCDWNDFAILYR